MWMLIVKFNILIILILCSSSKVSGAECPNGWFNCNNGECIVSIWVCDGENDCGNMEDEKDCDGKTPYQIPCLSSQFKCKSDDHCIPEIWHCDGDVDCSDRSDEMHCENVTSCTGELFRCRNGKCIPTKWHCDKADDCEDGSDEELCNDGKLCSDSEFICSSGSCLNKTFVCDGKKDCTDGSDEGPHCEAVSCRDDEIFCPLTDRCISPDFICDDNADCPDKRDEVNCTKSGWETITPYIAEGNEIIFVSEGSTILIQVKTDANESSKFNFTVPAAMISGLAYDNSMKRLFVADVKTPTIYAINLTTLQEEKLVVNRLVSPEDIAFDWMSNNLYWVDSAKGTVEVVSVINRKTVIVIEDLETPVSLALSPFSGNMFISTIGDEGCIEMYGMDGKNKRVLNSVQGFPISLALHPSKSILYWIDPRAGMILYINYTSSRSPWILKNGIDGIMSVAVSDQNLYWTTSDEPWQSEIERGIHNQRLPGFRNGSHRKRIAYSSGKKFLGKSECLIDNGGCSYLCLTSENGTKCACSSTMTLADDGRNCYGKKCEESDFKCIDGQCVPGETKCDGNIDCNDGSDELNCTR